ncbi:differentially expressed in FDCP 6 homolog isoform X2 [Triticum urartu]|uniref:differentially expressed in FDCP 6 homolog isoform X2 n=1 Tax=Triticum urartu TaxID=4572 RepID=UPI0020448EB6|nr:differentially expressed in FDCP 6 homolog isoform X2 [Triticum urartu]
MDSNANGGRSTMVGEMESSLERVRRQLSSPSTRHILQGPLLKRSDTLRKWNERWVILDPATGKMEYKVRRSDTTVRGIIVFDSTSTVTLSPTNFHGLPKYEGCCVYIGTPQKKEYFLCAETPSAARAWVSTLHATQLVLQAHKQAVDSLGGNGSAKLGTVATVVAVANATAIEASKEETLRVKDDELHQLLQDIRARDSTIREITDKLQETAEAAESAASAAHAIDEARRFLSSELERLKQDQENQVELSLLRLRESEEKSKLLAEEREHLLKERDSALQEAQMWRSELGKARGNAVILEAAVVRAEEKARVSAADADMRIKEAVSKLESAAKEKEELLALLDALKSQIQRQETSTKQICEERSELCSTSKHMDMDEDNVDKACLSDTDLIPIAENIVELDDEGVDIRTIGDTEWENPHSSEVSDVREVTTEAEENSLDIPVDSQPVADDTFQG